MDQDSPSYKAWILGGLMAVIVVIFTLILLPGKKKVIPPQNTLLPTASSSSVGNGGQTKILIKGQLGSLTVDDFINNGQTGPDPQNPGLYYLAGSPGYCLTDGSCPGGAPTTGYNITFNKNTQSFIISLLEEPLGKTRSVAEQFLKNQLGLSTNEMCSLHYYVGTVSALNDFYAGKNLGFSFCPNATVLPK